jgi:hypothetical protein
MQEKELDICPLQPVLPENTAIVRERVYPDISTKYKPESATPAETGYSRPRVVLDLKDGGQRASEPRSMLCPLLLLGTIKRNGRTQSEISGGEQTPRHSWWKPPAAAL